jgi:hypothetical protein
MAEAVKNEVLSRVPWIVITFQSISIGGQTPSRAVTHEAEITKTASPRLWLPALVFLPTLASSAQAPSSTAEIESPDLNLIVQRLEGQKGYRG